MRRKAAALVAAAAVVIAAFAVIVLVGVIPLPELPALRDAPDESIAGFVAYVSPRTDERCVHVVAAAGGPADEVYCPPDRGFIGQPVVWTPDGHLVVTVHGRLGAEVVIIDPQTRAVVDRITDTSARPLGPSVPAPDRTRRPDTASVLVDQPDPGVVEVVVRHEGDTREVYRARGPRDYRLDEVQWSPDGAWILIVDSRGRLAVMGASGQPAPRLLADDASSAAWYIPGNPEYTVDLAQIRR